MTSSILNSCKILASERQATLIRIKWMRACQFAKPKAKPASAAGARRARLLLTRIKLCWPRLR